MTADYKIAAGGVLRRADGAQIPDDMRNRDWMLYQEWLAAGNAPDPEFDPPTLAERRAVHIEAIDAASAVVMEQGAPFAGKRIQVTNGSRADLAGLATTAIAALSGAVPWPGSYAAGWIAIDNTRIAMPAPADGIALAASSGDWYAKVRQKARDLKDAVLASDNPEAVDLVSGWPS